MVETWWHGVDYNVNLIAICLLILGSLFFCMYSMCCNVLLFYDINLIAFQKKDIFFSSRTWTYWIIGFQNRRKDVEILLPVTSRIPSVHDWSVDGMITYVNKQVEV